MYRVIKKIRDRQKLKSHKRDGKLLNMVIIMFISFSLLNVFLILNFISILNNIATI